MILPKKRDKGAVGRNSLKRRAGGRKSTPAIITVAIANWSLRRFVLNLQLVGRPGTSSRDASVSSTAHPAVYPDCRARMGWGWESRRVLLSAAHSPPLFTFSFDLPSNFMGSRYTSVRLLFLISRQTRQAGGSFRASGQVLSWLAFLRAR